MKDQKINYLNTTKPPFYSLGGITDIPFCMQCINSKGWIQSQKCCSLMSDEEYNKGCYYDKEAGITYQHICPLLPVLPISAEAEILEIF